MKNDLKDFVALDLEVTGDNPTVDLIIKFDAVRFRNGKLPMDRFQEVCNPGAKINESTQAKTGISLSVIKKARPTDIVQAAFFHFLGGCPLIIHNAQFDMAFINAECERSHIDKFANTVIDTLTLARKTVKNAANFKLETLSAIAKISTDEPAPYQVGRLWLFLQVRASKRGLDPMLGITRENEMQA